MEPRVTIREDMSPEEEAIAADFEQGWSPERIAAATTRLGPAAPALLPEYLSALVRERAEQEGTDELSIVRRAVEAYLIPA